MEHGEPCQPTNSKAGTRPRREHNSIRHPPEAFLEGFPMLRRDILYTLSHLTFLIKAIIIPFYGADTQGLNNLLSVSFIAEIRHLFDVKAYF